MDRRSFIAQAFAAVGVGLGLKALPRRVLLIVDEEVCHVPAAWFSVGYANKYGRCEIVSCAKLDPKPEVPSWFKPKCLTEPRRES